MKVILLDKRNRFRDDIRTRLLIDDERDVELVTDLGDSNSLSSAISRYQPDVVVVADNVYPERSSWATLNVPVVGYITAQGGEDIFTVDGIPHYPRIANAAHLLDLLEGGIPSMEKPRPVAAPSVPTQSPTFVQNEPNVAASMPSGFPAPFGMSSEASVNPATTNTFPGVAPHTGSARGGNQNSRDTIYAPNAEAPGAVNNAPAPQSVPAGFAPMFAPMNDRPATSQPIYPSMQSNQPQQGAQGFPLPTYGDVQPHSQQPQFDPRVAGVPAGSYNPHQNTSRSDPVNTGANTKAQLDGQRAVRNASAYSSGVLEDIAAKNTTTKTIAVYSAKGGVGKTTITTELATILSMTSHGRGNYRVCLVDYNVDFGDILTTLNLDSRGPNLTHWTADVRRRMQNGEDPDSIYYGRKEIEGRLQRVGNSSLYALVAPITHEDSMDIRSEEPGVILRNIIENGCFDFVVCDTGNNTRDATVSALDAADVIFLIATQDVSAVNCDKSFLQTMHRVGFDVDKIRLIMNGVMPYKYTQVSVEEVEGMFPYPCIARFKRDPEVTRANNCSEPIVKNPNHEFTREMRKVVAYLTGNPVPQEKPKGGIFSIFKKKG